MEKINLNKISEIVTKREGLKKNVDIGQVKEVQKLTFEELGKFSDEQIIEVINRYR